MSESDEIYAVAAAVTEKKAKNSPGPDGNSHFPLASSYLCQDCNSVGNNSVSCPACASQVLLGLATVLNREPDAETAEYSSLPELTV